MGVCTKTGHDDGLRIVAIDSEMGSQYGGNELHNATEFAVGRSVYPQPLLNPAVA
jgi:hypothetical protein